MEPTPLCMIMGNYGSDKGHTDISRSWHNYTLLYYKLFKDIKDNNLRVFELGLGTNNINIPSNMGVNGKPGASLYGWSEFFPNSKIFGADIDKNILFETDKIKTYYCDQLNSNDIKNMWNNNELSESFDIIIDDGLHRFDANVCFFENSIHKLKKGGYYIIEDIINSCINDWQNKIYQWKIIYPQLKFDIVKIPSIVNNCDNNLIIISF